MDTTRQHLRRNGIHGAVLTPTEHGIRVDWRGFMFFVRDENDVKQITTHCKCIKHHDRMKRYKLLRWVYLKKQDARSWRQNIVRSSPTAQRLKRAYYCILASHGVGIARHNLRYVADCYYVRLAYGSTYVATARKARQVKASRIGLLINDLSPEQRRDRAHQVWLDNVPDMRLPANAGADRQ